MTEPDSFAVPRAGRGRPRRRRRLVTWPRVALGLVLLALPLAWAGWHVWQGVRALEAAAGQVRTLQTDLGELEGAAAQLQAISGRTRSAREHLHDPVVRALGKVPVLGEPLTAAGAVAASTDLALREALLPLLSAAGDDPAGRLTSGPGALDVDYLASLAPPANDAQRALTEAGAALAGAPRDTVVQRVDEAVSDFAGELDRLRTAVDDVVVALDVAPKLLGQDGPKRYLVISQSPAEARGTGGLIGGYSVLEVTDGALEIVRSGPRSDLQTYPEPVIDLGPQFDDHYGLNGAAALWVNSNLSPHFPYAGQIWTALWERQYGERLDGALLLDPIALSYLLEASGPITLPDGTQVTSANVADLTLRDVYARFTDDRRRDGFLQLVSTGVATALTTRDLPGRELVRAARRAVDERRLLLWSAQEEVQAQLAGQPVSGTLPESPAVGDVVIDAIGSKLDYYLERRLRFEPSCGEGRSRLTLTLTNAAPASGLPDYVTPRGLRRGEPPGTNELLVSLYLPGDSLLHELTVDGQDVFFRQGNELELTWVETEVLLRPGASKDVVAEFTSASGADGDVARLAQPLVRPEEYVVSPC